MYFGGFDSSRRAAGASFDWFGLLVMQSGGNFVRLSLDDLAYPADPPGARRWMSQVRTILW